MFTSEEIKTNDVIADIESLNERLAGIEAEMYNHNDVSLRATQLRSFNRLRDKRYSMLLTLKALIYAEIEADELSDDSE